MYPLGPSHSGSSTMSGLRLVNSFARASHGSLSCSTPFDGRRWNGGTWEGIGDGGQGGRRRGWGTVRGGTWQRIGDGGVGGEV